MSPTFISPLPDYELPDLEQYFPCPPSNKHVDKASKDVMRIISEEFPMIGRHKMLRASQIARKLCSHGHTLAAALFGLKKIIFTGELFVLPCLPEESHEWTPWNAVNVFVKEEWSDSGAFRNGPFGMILNQETHSILRQGYEELSLDHSDVGWLIVEIALDVHGKQLSPKDKQRLKERYKSHNFSHDAKSNAVNRLNVSLKKVGLIIKGWHLHDLTS